MRVRTGLLSVAILVASFIFGSAVRAVPSAATFSSPKTAEGWPLVSAMSAGPDEITVTVTDLPSSIDIATVEGRMLFQDATDLTNDTWGCCPLGTEVSVTATVDLVDRTLHASATGLDPTRSYIVYIAVGWTDSSGASSTTWVIGGSSFETATRIAPGTDITDRLQPGPLYALLRKPDGSGYPQGEACVALVDETSPDGLIAASACTRDFPNLYTGGTVHGVVLFQQAPIGRYRAVAYQRDPVTLDAMGEPTIIAGFSINLDLPRAAPMPGGSRFWTYGLADTTYANPGVAYNNGAEIFIRPAVTDTTTTVDVTTTVESTTTVEPTTTSESTTTSEATTTAASTLPPATLALVGNAAEVQGGVTALASVDVAANASYLPPLQPVPPPIEDLLTPRILTVVTRGLGSVAGPRVGVSCGADCTGVIFPGTSVSLRARPPTGVVLSSWGGACSGASLSCSFAASTDTTVRARFNTLPAPRAVTAGTSHSCAIVYDHTARCWGLNSNGQLGNGSLTDSVTPRAVAGLGSVRAIDAGGDFTCAVSDGQVAGAAHCWGRNNRGQLGDGTQTNRSRPTAVIDAGGSSLTGARSISGGRDFACALFAPGTAGVVECWGANDSGQLGDGSTTSRPRSAYVETANGTPLMGVTSISVGGQTACAVLTSGAVQCWGEGSAGQLGNASIGDSTHPVAVVGLDGTTPERSAQSVVVGGAFGCALLEARTISCWGANGSGQLGSGVRTASTTAGTVMRSTTKSLSGVYALAAGESHACARIGTPASASVWCWGENGSGQLGNGTTTDGLFASRVALSSVGAFTLAAGARHTIVIVPDDVRTPTSAIAWGANSAGQLGAPTSTPRRTPEPIARL